MANIGIIGAGYWGKNLVRNFHKLKALSVICDKNKDALKEYRAQYPGVKTATDAEKVLKDKNIEGVVIAVPAVHHYRLAKEALANDKHVFVEKPLALKADQAKELIDLAAKKKKILMVGHILQYHNAVIKLKELVDSGELGKIQYVYSNRLNIGKIRAEENILWSFAPHDISVILMLLGESPESVFTAGSTYLQHNVADVTLTTMNFPSGVKAHIFVSWLHPFKEQKLVVVGDKKMAVFDDMSDKKLFLYPHKIKWVDRIPIASRADAETVTFKMKEPLEAECRHFIDCIKKSRAPRTDGHEGLRVLQILEASQRSLNDSGRVVQLAGPEKKDDKKYFVHESAYIDEGAVIGPGTKIWNFSHVLEGSRIGEDCRIGQNVVIGPDAVVGNNCKIQNNVSVYKGVTLEDDVFCGPSMVFTNVFNPRSAIPRMKELKETLVKKGASIGANATIVCGNTIGRSSFIGASAVVTKDVPDYALVLGNPARQVGWMCECGVKIDFKGKSGKCPSCGTKYKKEKGKIKKA